MLVTLTSVSSPKECVQLVASKTSAIYLVMMMRMVMIMIMIEASAFIDEVYKASLELLHYFIVSFTPTAWRFQLRTLRLCYCVYTNSLCSSSGSVCQ